MSFEIPGPDSDFLALRSMQRFDATFWDDRSPVTQFSDVIPPHAQSALATDALLLETGAEWPIFTD